MTVPVQVSTPGHQPQPGRRTIAWDRDDVEGIDTNLDPWMARFGAPSVAAVTLGRIGVAAFLTDRTVRRNALRQRRDIELVVSVPDPDLARQAQLSVQRLLGFVTGDHWQVEFERDTSQRPAAAPQYQADEVALLSGGLDSYCGALISGATDRVFLSHSDASVIKHSQNRSAPTIPGYDATQHATVRLAARAPFNREASRRSRSVLFLALAVALADAAGAGTVEVPENGFTSLNPPLAANRAGVLTTRSTHPTTFERFNQVVRDLGVAVTLRNPYEWHTKGELVAAAVTAAGAPTVLAGIPHTLSCAKSNLILKGKTFGRNCGLDYACMVRRAGIEAAGLVDPTTYECHTPALAAQVERERRQDITAVKQSLADEPSLLDLAAMCGPFPAGYDMDRALALWNRGANELSSLTLP